MAFLDDWSLDYSTKKISHTAQVDRARWLVQDFYSELMDLFDDAAQMDDAVPMSAQTPREFTLINGWSMNADSDYGYLYGGAVVDTTNNDVWACFYSLGTIVAGTTNVYVEQDGNLVASSPGYAAGDHIDMLIKVTDSGVDTDSKQVTAYTRDHGYTYDHYLATASDTGGYNPIPLGSLNDINDAGGGAAYTGITIEFGTISRDLGDGAGANDYSVEVDGNNYTTAQVYEYLKYITRRENTSAIDSPENTTEGRFYQTANASYTVIKQAPFGTYAGGTFFGAQGVWLTNVSDANNVQLIDNAGTIHTPPTSISVSVSGLVSGDRVLVAKDDGTGDIEKDTYTISSVTTSTIVATAALASDTPATGTVRVGDTRYEYTSWSGSTFSGVTPDPTGETGDFFVPYIDDAAVTGTVESPSSLGSGTIIYSTDRDVIARVRAYGILPFEQTGLTVANSGLSVSAIRNADNIVT